MGESARLFLAQELWGSQVDGSGRTALSLGGLYKIEALEADANQPAASKVPGEAWKRAVARPTPKPQTCAERSKDTHLHPSLGLGEGYSAVSPGLLHPFQD